MRNSFIKQITAEMQKNKNIIFLTGDLGFNALEPIQKSFPDRFINVGIAEANMIGIAAGLALTGKKVITYSISPFITMRAYEQIRDDVCYHNLDVKIIGTGGGYNYGTHGVTHHSIEDLAIMSVLPNMQVFAPSHAWEAEEATKAIMKSEGPAYMRLGKNPTENFHKSHFKFTVGKGVVVKPGNDVLLMITGNLLDYGMKISEIVEKATGAHVAVVSMPCIKPINEKWLTELMKPAKLIVTLEEHSLDGGLGSKIAMILATRGTNKKFLALGTPDYFLKNVGGRDFLLKKAGLDPQTVSKKIISCLKKKK